MFKNKHMALSMVVAPLLAICSYFAMDAMIADVPESAQSGASYSLLAKPNCRYESGHCTLRNGDFELHLRLTETDNGEQVLMAKASHPLQGAQVALVEGDADEPLLMTKTDDGGEHWVVPVQGDAFDKHELRIAMLSDNTTFYGSTQTTFFRYDKVYPRSDW